MASALTVTEIDTETKRLLQSQATVDPDFAAADFLAAYNSAYQDVWMESGGRTKSVASATAWSVATTTTSGFMTGILDGIEEVLQAWFTATSSSTGGTEGTDFVIRETERPEIEFMRGRNAAQGTYGTIQMYSVDRLQTSVNADKNKVRLDFWPAIASLYIPVKYVQQFVPFTAVNSDIPELTDAESRDIPLLAAIDLAPLRARWDLIDGFVRKLSARGQLILTRRERAQDNAKQNRVP